MRQLAYNIKNKFIGTVFFTCFLVIGSNLIAESECVKCHEASTPKAMAEYKESAHFKSSVSCINCHGGDDKAKSKEDSHSEKAAFKGKFSTPEESNICGTCHAEEVKYSVKNPHFSAKGRWDPIKCVNCHGVHKNTIPAKGLFISQEEGSCNTCHKDKEGMGYAVAEGLQRNLDNAFEIISRLENKKKEIKDSEAINVLITEKDKTETKLKNLKRLMHNLSLDQAGDAFHEIDSIAKSAIVYAEMLEKKANEHYLITLILVGIAIVGGFLAVSFIAAYILLKIIRRIRSKSKVV